MKEMYKGVANSPETTITNDINNSDTLIYVLDETRIPSELPNLMVLGTGTSAETVKVLSIEGNAITVERGFQGVAKSWNAGTVIARNFTEYDYNALVDNVKELDEKKATKEGVSTEVNVHNSDEFAHQHILQEIDDVKTQCNQMATDIEEHKSTTTQRLDNLTSTKAENSNLQLTDTIAKDAQTKANNPLGQITDNSISSLKLKQSTDADKIKLSNLAKEVRDAMAGTTTIGTTPAPGSVTTVELANDGVTSQKVSALAYGKPYMMPGLVLPNYDTKTRTLHFNSDSTYKCMLWYKDTKYDIPVGTTVVDNNSTSAVQLIFNTISKEFSFVGHTVKLNENELRVGAYKRYAGFYQWDFPCNIAIDGTSPGGHSSDRSNLGEVAIILGTEPVDFDFTNNRMHIPFTPGGINIIWRNQYYAIKDEPVIDLSLMSGDRGLVYFNVDTKTFNVYESNTLKNVSEYEILVAVYWIASKRVYMLGDYTVDGMQTNYNSTDALPAYFKNEAIDTVEKVQNNTINKSLVLTVLTDTHADNIKHLKNTAKNIIEVNKYIRSDAIVHLGDLTDGNKDIHVTMSTLRETYKLLGNSDIPLFTVVGNHDDNSYGSNKEISNLITRDKWYSVTQRQIDSNPMVERFNNNPYYYVDYPKQKIRLIMLCAVDYVSPNSGFNWWGYEQEQIEWLGETALNVKDEYGVIIFSHMPTRAELNYNMSDNINNGSVVEDVLQTFTSKGVYSYGDKIFDYTDKNGIEVIAYIFGHIHSDIIKTPVGLSYPFISIANASPTRLNSKYLPTGSINYERDVGTVTEDCWDMIAVRRDERKIYLTRFGAGEDRVVSY